MIILVIAVEFEYSYCNDYIQSNERSMVQKSEDLIVARFYQLKSSRDIQGSVYSELEKERIYSTGGIDMNTALIITCLNVVKEQCETGKHYKSIVQERQMEI